MSMGDKTEQSADLRWPSFSGGLLVGFFVILIMSIIMVALQLKLPEGSNNPWLVIKPDGFGPLQKSITAVVTTHFFHDSWDHLWRNVGGLWCAGLMAFAFAGYGRAMMAMVYGGLLSGIVLLCVGSEGATYMGGSALVFAFMGLMIPTALRKGLLTSIFLIIGFSFIGNLLFDSIRESLVSAEYGVVWLGYLCGVVGGIMADLNNPTEAVRVLHKNGIIGGRATEALLRETCPELYTETPVYEEELMSAAEEILKEEAAKKKAKEDAIRAKQRKEAETIRSKQRTKEGAELAKQRAKDEKNRSKQDIQDAKSRAKQMTKEAKTQAKEAKKQAKESNS